MNRLATVLMATLLASPTLAQTWGSDYNMGSIGVGAGNEASGSITLDCAQTGNAFVDQGTLSIFVRPQPGMLTNGQFPDDLVFDIDGQAVSLPVSDNPGDGFIYEKTPETSADLSSLVGLLSDGQLLTILSESNIITQISLDGAAAVLESLETCLTP